MTCYAEPGLPSVTLDTSVQSSGSIPSVLPDLTDTTTEFLRPQPRTLPPFLQRHPAATAAAAVSGYNADTVAEASAASPGPLGDGMAPEDWFDCLVVSYLAARWKEHAAAIDRGVLDVVTVCCC